MPFGCDDAVMRVDDPTECSNISSTSKVHPCSLHHIMIQNACAPFLAMMDHQIRVGLDTMPSEIGQGPLS
jgi:hypothetical protein